MPMHPSFADWYRSAGVSPPEGMLQRRWDGVEELAQKTEVDLIIGLIRLFVLPSSKETMVPSGMRDAFRAHDEAFESKGNLQELRVLAGAVLRHIVEQKNPSSTLAALGLVCACFATRLATVPERDHIDAAERLLVAEGRELRALRNVPTLEAPSFTKEKYDALVQAASFQPQTIPNAHEQLFNAFNEVTQNFSKSFTHAREAIDALRYTVEVQGEELNMLWWLQTATSRDLEKSFRDVGPTAGALIFPMEIADLTVLAPGPNAVLGVLLRALETAGASTSFELSIAEAANATPRSWREKTTKLHKTSSAKELCPIILALEKSLETDGPNEWIPIYRKACDIPSDGKIPGVQFSTQVYRERLLLRSIEESAQ